MTRRQRREVDPTSANDVQLIRGEPFVHENFTPGEFGRIARWTPEQNHIHIALELSTIIEVFAEPSR